MKQHLAMVGIKRGRRDWNVRTRPTEQEREQEEIKRIRIELIANRQTVKETSNAR